MRRAAGALLLLLLAALAVSKAQDGVLAEMLWACHVTDGLLGLGLLLGWRRCAAIGFLYQVAIAVPTFVLHLASGGASTWLSIGLHTLTPVIGVLAWRRQRLPSPTPWWTLGVFGVLVVLARAFTPAAMNINLAFGPWAPVAWAGVWVSWGCNMALMAALLLLVQWLWNRRLPI